MSQKTTYTCDWCGETAKDLERMVDWHLMWNLHGNMTYLALHRGKLEDLCPECWKALEASVEATRSGRKKTT